MNTFRSADTAHRARNGQQCEVIRTITEPDASHDAEVLPMHVVRFADGVELEAFADEIG